MLLDIILIGCSAIFATLLFFSKRSTGPIILALCAGAFLENAVGGQFAAFLLERQLSFPNIDITILVSLLLTLLPALIIWPFCVKNHSTGRQLVGSIIAAVVFASLISSYAEVLFVNEIVEAAKSLVLLQKIQPYILGVAVLYAVIDFVLAHAKVPSRGKKH